MAITTTTTTTEAAGTSTKSTTGVFNYIDPTSFGDSPSAISVKPWGKVDGGGSSYSTTPVTQTVTNLRFVSDPSSFNTDTAGFGVHTWPTDLTPDDFFADQDSADNAVRTRYYDEVSALLKAKLPGKVRDIVMFDHTIRRRIPGAARQPVQLVHVDQTPPAVATRVRRHLPSDIAEEALSSGRRYQLINVWKPIGHAANDFPLAVVDWRSTSPRDFVPVDLLYPAARRRMTATTAARRRHRLLRTSHARGMRRRARRIVCGRMKGIGSIT